MNKMKIEVTFDNQIEASTLIYLLAGVSLSAYRNEKTKKIAYKLLKDIQLQILKKTIEEGRNNAR